MLNPWAAKAVVGAAKPKPDTGEAAQPAQHVSDDLPGADQLEWPRRRSRKNQCGHKGVSALKNGKWQARLPSGNQQNLGCFDSAEEAAAKVAAAMTHQRFEPTRVHKQRGTVRVACPCRHVARHTFWLLTVGVGVSQAKKSCSDAADGANTEAPVQVGSSSFSEQYAYLDIGPGQVCVSRFSTQASYWQHTAAAHGGGLDGWLVARNE